ncbi:hypothetical protein AUEXF2481DRAFT_42230 [Aureobasidium subglaciale EXF-2481]|uniref:SnoaL-like domain-containing protein n=1 Tax=Aureobasidium subglaciale (strain EXF-2481) TaxID=1043005 RepID=A0A074Z1T7_AURSE|nr:uncharacterized protein AUEXF2481DRAFT_42230 [Aureobasidium subglaciale EXF-2481]KAI5195619.1 hypothetical protein E4T38_08942 [Aureobasidium subglaciale]KAI5214621.1 hypothetical protein E4T40_08912 [Aureobasidium subglaciale]KAI5217406.1 hypothetical protein E4T41_08871 [Aureobasidium subglaciale]KAI5255026.1 hypothetical protein E4T46_08905 [Aureobasidium subglaciale]KEQ93031.1 hypothetical protein AUEXF2481DRAFT_42230 [Aureobasidium subglaciale EXF-2481]
MPNIKPVATAEYDAVIASVQKYVEGLRVGDNKIIAQAFNKDATMYGFAPDGKLLGGPISNLYTYVDQFGAAPEIKTRLDILSITPSTAVVRVDMEGDGAGVSYTDFHTLLKFGEKWEIIAKVFHAYE